VRAFATIAAATERSGSYMTLLCSTVPEAIEVIHSTAPRTWRQARRPSVTAAHMRYRTEHRFTWRKHSANTAPSFALSVGAQANSLLAVPIRTDTRGSVGGPGPRSARFTGTMNHQAGLLTVRGAGCRSGRRGAAIAWSSSCST